MSDLRLRLNTGHPFINKQLLQISVTTFAYFALIFVRFITMEYIIVTSNECIAVIIWTS